MSQERTTSTDDGRATNRVLSYISSRSSGCNGLGDCEPYTQDEVLALNQDPAFRAPREAALALLNDTEL